MSDFTESRKKKVANARDVQMETVHLSVFNFGTKVKFLCDHRNNGNRHKQNSQRVNRQRTRPWRSRQRVKLIVLRTSVRVSVVAIQKEHFFCFISNNNKYKKYGKILNKNYNQLKRLEPK